MAEVRTVGTAEKVLSDGDTLQVSVTTERSKQQILDAKAVVESQKAEAVAKASERFDTVIAEYDRQLALFS